jgi:hypothetical protein
MNTNTADIIKKTNLHNNRTDFSDNMDYVEFSFHACFSDLFNLGSFPWSFAKEGLIHNKNQDKITGAELFDIMDLLKIDYNRDLIYYSYLDENNQSVEVFHSNVDEQVFAYFDFYKAPEAQIDMFFLGISCNKRDEKIVHELLVTLYKKIGTTSPFTFTNQAENLYNKVFRSYHHFYDNDYNERKRQLHHHNLP